VFERRLVRGLIVVVTAVLLGAFAQAALASSSHHKRKHRRPHPQALSVPLRKAHVRVLKAPERGGKGGNVDPGDDYPQQWKNLPMDAALDPWKEYTRECTSFVAWALSSRNGFAMPFFDNANKWGPDAARRGFAVNSSPAVGSVAWSNAGFFGHVAYVVAVSGATVTIEEYNHYGNGTYDKRNVPASAFNGYIHFKDIPGEFVAPSPAAAPQPPGNPSAPTFAETTGGVAHTWTNYTNAGGTQGPSIPSNATVQISCALQGFRVADGNTWWYRIASGPWNNAFYVSADAFYNNGQTSGSLIGTPFVDPAVSPC